MLIDSVRCEVLNASYDPLSIVSGRRALNLYLQGKATILTAHPSGEIQSGNDVWPIPTQIRLHHMVKSRRTTRAKAQLTQRNMFVRDLYMCQYCGRHRMELNHGEFLTRDHVIPQSKGGADTWGNVVTACNKCNNKKADFTCEEVGMFPAKQPVTPTVYEIWAKSTSKNKKKPG